MRERVGAGKLSALGVEVIARVTEVGDGVVVGVLEVFEEV